MQTPYQAGPVPANSASRDVRANETGQLIGAALEELARQGAREMLARALEEEVNELLGRGRYERSGPGRGYRNGYAPERAIGTGMGRVEVQALLYLEGLSSGDFEPGFRA